jgi:hypothetical protein
MTRSIALFLATALGTIAPPSFAQMPPPPTSTLAFPQTTTTFTAPGATIGNLYRVVIDSNDPLVLSQVKQVEPKAFFQNFPGNRVLIQTGAFNTVYGAQQQQALLARYGYKTLLLGDATTGNPPIGTPPVKGNGYYTIIPTDLDRFTKDYEKIVRSGIPAESIQRRTQPLGLHYAIGPWSKRQGAEDMVLFLRNQTGLDARVYYQP